MKLQSTMTLTVAPEDLKKCFSAEQWNGFGFQYEGVSNGQLCLAFISKYVPDRHNLNFDEQLKISIINHETETTKIKEVTGSHTVCFDEWIGHDYLAIHWTEWELIPIVLQYVLDNGFQFRVNHKPKACFKPGDIFTLVNMEHKCIETFNDMLEQFKDIAIKKHQDPYACAYELMGEPTPLLYHWNWSTKKGIEFCTMLRNKLGKKPISKFKPRFTWPNYEETCKKYNILHHGEWSKRTPMYIEGILSDTVLVIGEKRNRDDDDDDDDNLCYICYENPSNTLVMPCGHVCVCSGCSDKLVDTHDKNICVKCRKNIEYVVEDGKKRRI